MAKDFDALEKFIIRFGRIIAKNANRIELVALKTVEGLFKDRIFVRGLDSNGRKIGSYSTKDMLIGAGSFRNKTQANKFLGVKKNRKKLSWVTKNNKRLAVLEGGYKKLRGLQGLRTSSVDLQYRGDLFMSIQTGRTPTGDNVIGFTKSVFKDKKATVDLQRIKAEAQEERFDTTIFSLSKTESKAIDKAVIREVDAILKSL